MTFSPAQIIDQTVSIIKKDRFILVPYILFFVVLHLMRQYLGAWIGEETKVTVYTIVFISGVWVADLVLKGVVMGFTVTLFRKEFASGSEVVSRLLHRLSTLLGSSVLVMIPLAGILYGLLGYSSDPAAVEWTVLKIIGAILLVPLSLILEFIPVEVMAGDESILSTLKKVFVFLKTRLSLVMMFTLLILLFMFLTLFVSQLMAFIPVIGASVLSNVAMGCGYTFVYVMTGVFYLIIIQPKVDVSITSDPDSSIE